MEHNAEKGFIEIVSHVLQNGKKMGRFHKLFDRSENRPVIIQLFVVRCRSGTNFFACDRTEKRQGPGVLNQ